VEFCDLSNGTSIVENGRQCSEQNKSEILANFSTSFLVICPGVAKPLNSRCAARAALRPRAPYSPRHSMSGTSSSPQKAARGSALGSQFKHVLSVMFCLICCDQSHQTAVTRQPAPELPTEGSDSASVLVRPSPPPETGLLSLRSCGAPFTLLSTRGVVVHMSNADCLRLRLLPRASHAAANTNDIRHLAQQLTLSSASRVDGASSGRRISRIQKCVELGSPLPLFYSVSRCHERGRRRLTEL
jgi:hypothetical protein